MHHEVSAEELSLAADGAAQPQPSPDDFAPVALIGVHNQLNPGRMADEFIGPQADWMLLKTIDPDLLAQFVAPKRAAERHRPKLLPTEFAALDRRQEKAFDLTISIGGIALVRDRTSGVGRS